MSSLLLLAAKKQPQAALPSANNTLLLMHFDSNYVDAAGSAITGNGTFSTSTYKFGSASVNFANAQIATVPTNTKFQTGITEGTAEAWVYKTATMAYGCIVGQGSASASYSGFDISSSNNYDIAYVSNISGTAKTVTPVIAKGAIPLNTWSHIAMVWKNNVATGYLNGVQQLSGSNPDWFLRGNTSMFIGNISYSQNYPFAGYIDELRISNVARYTTNFTVPSSPFTLD